MDRSPTLIIGSNTSQAIIVGIAHLLRRSGVQCTTDWREQSLTTNATMSTRDCVIVIRNTYTYYFAQNHAGAVWLTGKFTKGFYLNSWSVCCLDDPDFIAKTCWSMHESGAVTGSQYNRAAVLASFTPQPTTRQHT